MAQGPYNQKREGEVVNLPYYYGQPGKVENMPYYYGQPGTARNLGSQQPSGGGNMAQGPYNPQSLIDLANNRGQYPQSQIPRSPQQQQQQQQQQQGMGINQSLFNQVQQQQQPQYQGQSVPLDQMQNFPAYQSPQDQQQGDQEEDGGFGYPFFMPRRQGNFQGNQLAEMMDNFSLRQIAQGQGAAQDVADSVNFGLYGMRDDIRSQNDRFERDANRNFGKYQVDSRERMFNNLSKALLGGGGYGRGIQDTNSGLQVGGGNVSTNINARALPLSSILGADNSIRNSGAGAYGPSRSVGPQAQGELNQLMQGRLRNIAPNVERNMMTANTPFRRSIEGARGQQFQGLGNLQSSLQRDQIGRQGTNLRTLMSAARGM